jgi:predicted short-subunit dehydrogenase-like oxidoreductase (DUF2520 family)
MTSRLPNYLLIGSGRLAHHLRHYLSQFNVTIKVWSRNHSDFNTISINENSHAEARFEAALNDSDVVLLAISDSALAEWVAKAQFKNKVVVHFAGSRFFEKAWGFHPLMTFSQELYPAEFYKSIPFVADRGFPISEMFPFLPNPIYEIEPKSRPLYHALAHMAANFPALLWVHVFQQFESLGLPREILAPMLGKCFTNTVRLQEQALAGPLRRGDMQTLLLHEQTLETLPSLSAIYKSFTEWAISFPLVTTQMENQK